MVRKSKRKQTIIAFEKNILRPTHIDLHPYQSLLSSSSFLSSSSTATHDNSISTSSPSLSEEFIKSYNEYFNQFQYHPNIEKILHFLINLSISETQNQQIKLIQECKNSFKEILSPSLPSHPDTEMKLLIIKLLIMIVCDPSHIWFRKYFEWLFDAIVKSTFLTSTELRLTIRSVCSSLLDICKKENLLMCSIDRCFEWINTFQWMYQFDKEISWIDDAEWVSDEGCWNSSVWPAGQDLGDGTLLQLIETMEPLLRRCAVVLTDNAKPAVLYGGESSNLGATELMRFAECAGECMRILSAILKPRRGGIISTFSYEEENKNRWGVVADSILEFGCKILSSDLVSKDVLTSAALTVVNMQWLLRERLWDQADLLYRHRQRSMSEIKMEAPTEPQPNESSIPAPCTALQLIALLSLLRLDEKKSDNTAIGQLLAPYALLVGVSPILVTALTLLGEERGVVSYLSRCALLRACISVYDLSALMFQPYWIEEGNLSDELRSALAFVVTNGVGTKNRIYYSPTYMITPSEVEKVASYLACEMIPSHIRNNKELLDLYGSSGLFFGIIFEITASLCLESATPTLRLYGLQTMETWLGRIETENLCARVGTNDVVTGRDGQPISVASKILRNMLISRLASISLLLTKAWSHPAKLVNHMVPVVYQRVVALNHTLDATMQSRSIVGEPDYPDIWEPFITNALSQPVEHRGRYQALSALLPNVGGQKLLQLHPQIFRSLILSMRVRDVGSSVGSFFGNLLQSLFADALLTPHFIRKMYLTEVAEALTSSEYKLRINTADYIIPEVLSIDPVAGPLLIEKIRKVAKEISCNFVQTLWGIVSVVLHARLLGKNGGDIIESETYLLTDTEESATQHRHHWRPLTALEAEAVCLSEDVDLRLVGLAALTASQRTVNPLPDVELLILKKTLPYSLKSPLSDIRQRILRVLRNLVTRLKESYRSSIRDLKKMVLHRYKDSDNELVLGYCQKDNGVLFSQYILKQSNWPDTETKLSHVALQIVETFHWLSGLLLANIYPGAPNDREMMALEMLKCILNGITGNITSGFAEKSKNSHVTTHDDALLESALLSFYYTKQMTQSLLNLLISSWDKTRMLAAEILLLLPRPLPGYDTPAAVYSLWKWGCKLAGSAKQRESDSGALLLRVVHVIYSMDLKWSIHQPISADEKTPSDSDSPEPVHFITQLCTILEIRLSELSAVFDAIHNASVTQAITLPAMPTMLSHGLILALRYCLEDLYSSGILTTENFSNKKNRKSKKGENNSSLSLNIDWRVTIQKIMELARKGLEAALQIVAETPVDNYFAPVPKVDAGKEHLLQNSEKGNTHGYASDSFMLNTNIFMDLEDSHDTSMGTTTGKEDSIGRRMQYAVVGAWLLVKESCSLLAKLVEISPPPLSDTQESNTDPESTNTLLTTEEISCIGDVILDSLSRLKHNGAIAEAQVSLQSVCESVLKYSGRSNTSTSSSTSLSLSQLPMTWLDNLINKLNGEQQVFILRRSAGFAFSFLSLLRSEPKNCKPILLPIAMNTLFEFASKGCVGGIDDQPSSDAPSINVLEGVAWRTIVHSLNILRLIILDATLGPDLHPFIAQATKIAVRGFQSPLWAIRNSSMMVFSAVVQRTIDNDKKDSGGRRAATPREYFLRFPSLFPFILRELARIVGAVIEFDARGYPVNVIFTQSSNTVPHETHPSLYPILLMLSKMRTDALESVPSMSKSLNEEGVDSVTVGEESCDVELFIPLIQLCANQQLFQVRVMAAKALSSLVPLQKVPDEMVVIIQSLIDSFTVFSSQKTFKNHLSSNLLHGSLLQLLDLVSNLHWYVTGDSASMGTNEILYASILSNLDKLVIPKLIRLQQVMITAAVYQEQSTSTATTSTSNYFPYPPIILLTLKRMISIIYSLRCHNIVSELLIKICDMNVTCLFDKSGGVGVVDTSTSMPSTEPYHLSLQASKIPFAPLLWKESLIDLTKITFRNEFLQKYPGMEAVYSRNQLSETSKYKYDFPHPILDLIKLLQHPISEIREGILLGCLDAFLELTELNISVPEKEAVVEEEEIPTRNTLISSFLTMSSIIDGDSFLTILFRRILTEFEPPILQLTLQLILNLSLWIPFSSLDDDTKDNCLTSFRTLLQVSYGIYDPETMLDFLDQTMDKTNSAKFTELNTSLRQQEEENLTVAPTMAASFSLQILGWMVRSFFESSIINWPQSNDSNRPFGCLLSESICTIRNSKDLEEDEESSTITCSSWHVWSWFHLIELAGTGEHGSVDIRYAAAKSLLTSKALFWSTRSSVDGIRQDIQNSQYQDSKYSGGGAFSCRVWLLALKMLQDDDSDVRNVINSAVGTAAKLATVLIPELKSWFHHDLVHLPRVKVPRYDEFDVEPIEQIMRPFFHGISSHQVIEEKGDVNNSISRVQWAQGLILEQISLPFSLAILWSLRQYQSHGTVSDWVSEDSECQSIQEYLESRIHLYSPSTLLLLKNWINLIFDDEMEIKLPTSTSTSSTLPPPPAPPQSDSTTAAADANTIEGSHMEVPEKIFEADQTNLFEELTIYSSCLTYSLACATTLLPCSNTLSITIIICKMGIQTIDLLLNYLHQQPSQQHQETPSPSEGASTPTALVAMDSSLWLGGLTYHPIYYLKIYHALIGSAHLCQLYRHERKLNLPCHDSNTSVGDKDAIYGLFPLLLTLITKAKRLLIELRSQPNNSLIIHPSIISLLVAISGPNYIES